MSRRIVVPGGRAGWTPARVVALIAALLALALGMVLVSARAWAAFTPVSSGPHLSVGSDLDPTEFLDLSPGTTRYWQLSTTLVDPSSSLTMRFWRSGDLVTRPDGLVVGAQLCPTPWNTAVATPTCAAGGSVVIAPTSAGDASFGAPTANGAPLPANAPVYSLGTLTNAHPRYLLVSLGIPDTAAARVDPTLMGLTADIGLGFTVIGDGSTPTPSATTAPAADDPSGLAATGVTDVLALVLVAAGVLGVGIVLRLTRATGVAA